MAANDPLGDENSAGPAGGAGGAGGPKGGGVLGSLVKAESFLQLAIALPAGCLIGWFAGNALDKHFHQHWMGVVGILLGAAGGFIQMYTMASRYLKRDE